MTLITLSGRRWNTHGSSKEGSGKEAGSEKASQKGGSEEEIIFILHKEFFCGFLFTFQIGFQYDIVTKDLFPGIFLSLILGFPIHPETVKIA